MASDAATTTCFFCGNKVVHTIDAHYVMDLFGPDVILLAPSIMAVALLVCIVLTFRSRKAAR